MQQMMQTRPKTMNPQPAPLRVHWRGFLEPLVRGLTLSVLALLAMPAILGGKNLPAQTHDPQSTKPALQQKAVAKRAQPRNRAVTHAHVASIGPQPAPEATAA